MRRCMFAVLLLALAACSGTQTAAQSAGAAAPQRDDAVVAEAIRKPAGTRGNVAIAVRPAPVPVVVHEKLTADVVGVAEKVDQRVALHL